MIVLGAPGGGRGSDQGHRTESGEEGYSAVSSAVTKGENC